MSKLDNAFGMHELALKLRSQRMEVLASNLANADTPGYKAKDIDFKAVLSSYQNGAASSAQASKGMKVTHERHLGASDGMAAETLYRNPLQPSLDGNTVDAHVEKGKFMENALQYQATLSFIDSRIQSLRKAIRGD
ncbi:MAG: flagellar basal body rod protein FlgB [Chromatiales bacterium]|nr:flagellar basal body rod protein FlgB [Gammaproteobacteria bacterium]MBW6476637.1 flagellar basal body rod protein FlgB [Chromatiales bacterium]